MIYVVVRNSRLSIQEKGTILLELSQLYRKDVPSKFVRLHFNFNSRLTCKSLIENLVKSLTPYSS